MNAVIELAQEPEVILLGAARSHTDRSARAALSEFSYDEKLLVTLDRFGYLIRAGDEWRLDENLRQSVLQGAHQLEHQTWHEVHSYYFSIAKGQATEGAPAYLTLGPGYAYHGSEIDRGIGEEGYRRVAHVDSVAISVDALRMANEQGTRGVVDLDSQPLVFLRGMTYYRAGQQRAAIDLLRTLAKSPTSTSEVAIAQHLVAWWDCQRGGPALADESKRFFNLSLKSGVARGDVQHQAHVKHSMALCLIQQGGSNYRRVVNLLLSSLAQTAEIDDEWGRAKVLHSLGQVMSGRPSERTAARRHLQESREIGLRLNYRNHVESVDKSLAALGVRKSLGVSGRARPSGKPGRG